MLFRFGVIYLFKCHIIFLLTFRLFVHFSFSAECDVTISQEQDFQSAFSLVCGKSWNNSLAIICLDSSFNYTNVSVILENNDETMNLHELIFVSTNTSQHQRMPMVDLKIRYLFPIVNESNWKPPSFHAYHLNIKHIHFRTLEISYSEPLFSSQIFSAISNITFSSCRIDNFNTTEALIVQTLQFENTLFYSKDPLILFVRTHVLFPGNVSVSFIDSVVSDLVNISVLTRKINPQHGPS